MIFSIGISSARIFHTVETDAVFDTGCTQPISTKTDGMKNKIEPLDEVLQIVQASGETLTILGTIRMYLKADVLGCRRLVECTVI